MAVVLCEGFLTKSPPEHKINRARWCRRYFQLCNIGGEILLQYYKDDTCSKLKGTINLRECEQVDQGLSFETKSKLKDAYIFDVVTQRRKYFLVTETEAEMLRWVQNICSACGFQSDDALSENNDGGEPSTTTQPPGAVGNSYSPEMIGATTMAATSSQPPTTNGDESYIPLDECNTGEDSITALKVSSKSSSPQQPGQQSKKKWDTMSSTSSSAPSDSAPSPPPSRPTSQIDGGVMDDVYDVPPARTSEDAPPVPMRPAPVEESVYKLVPACKDPTSLKFDRQISLPGNRGSYSTCSDDLTSSGAYDFVRGSSERSSGGMFDDIDEQQTTYDMVPPPRPPPPTMEEVYQVPPSRPSIDQDCDYDIPPLSPPIESTYDVLPSPLQRTQDIPTSHLKVSDSISKSTDDLARSFEEISQQNATQSVTITNGDLEHSTYDPVPALDLNASIGSNSSFSVFSDHGASSTAIEAPPRPAKPAFMYPSTPPSSVDEKYIVSTKPSQEVSPQEVRNRRTSMERRESSGASPQRNGPKPPSMSGHHQWLDQQIPPASYINAKRPGTTRPSSTFTHRSFPQRASTMTAGRAQSGVPLGFQNGHSGMVNGQPGSYMPMQGSSESAKMMLGGAITEDSYMPMQSQNEANPSVYSNMSSSPPAPAIPRRPPRQSTSSIISTSSTTSQDSMPPPIDRSSKPRSTDPTILHPELIGLEGSFYATGPDLPPDFPVQCTRTKSFSKKPTRPRDPQGPFSSTPPRTPPRPLRSLKSSSSSSVGEHTSIGDLYSVPPSATSMQDDAYPFADQTSPSRPKIDTRHSSIDSTIHPHSSQTLPPSSHQVEYLELDHDIDTQSSALPPKATSPKDQVEYIHLDLEKTKALQEVTQNREEVYRGDTGTLKK